MSSYRGFTFIIGEASHGTALSVCAYSYFLSTPNTRASSRDSTRGERTTTIFIICPFTPVFSAEKQLPFVLRSYYSPLSFYAPRAHGVTRCVSPIRKPCFCDTGSDLPPRSDEATLQITRPIRKATRREAVFSRASGGFLFRFLSVRHIGFVGVFDRLAWR